MSIKREYDILVYGATGFTGKLVAEYLVTNAPSSVKLAIGGRSLSKLQDVAAGLASSSALGILVADSFDLKALEDMVSKTRIVISTVGPFAKYGEKLVQACVSNSTNYIDSTGEPDFIRRLIDNYHAEAFKKNVKIVPSCGFDSLPSDLGTFLIADHFKKLNAKTSTVEAVFLDVSGGISGGTIATMCHYIQNSSYEELQKLASNGDYLAPDSHSKHRVHTRTTFHYSKSIGTWVTPFMMEAANLRYVRRSASLLKYGPNFQYSEGASARNAVFGVLTTAAYLFAMLMVLIKPLRILLQWCLPPGTGPSKSVRDKGHFTEKFFGEGLTDVGQAVSTFCIVKGINDPGYGETAKMLSESALCLLLDEDKLKQDNQVITGGILTTSSGMGMTLVERLRKAGMTFALTDK